MLEPCEAKVSCTVLRGEWGREAPDLPDRQKCIRLVAQMTKDQLSNILGKIDDGAIIPGTIAGKYYKYKGKQSYSGRGKFSKLKGVEVVILQSDDRERAIILFLEPILILLSSNYSDLSYGKLPPEYVKRYHNGAAQEIPNIYEYESHYKSLARYVQQLTSHLIEPG